MRKCAILIFTILIAALAASITGCKSYNESVKEDSRQDSIAGILARHLVEQQEFLLKGDRLTIKSHNFPYVNSTTNFIQVNGHEGTVQVSPAFSGGPNGVGGFTVTGTVTKYEVKQLSKGQVRVSFHISAPIGSCEVSITVYAHSAQCVANINSTFRSGRASLYGRMIPIDNSVYQGRYPF